MISGTYSVLPPAEQICEKTENQEVHVTSKGIPVKIYWLHMNRASSQKNKFITGLLGTEMFAEEVSPEKFLCNRRMGREFRSHYWRTRYSTKESMLYIFWWLKAEFIHFYSKVHEYIPNEKVDNTIQQRIASAAVQRYRRFNIEFCLGNA